MRNRHGIRTWAVVALLIVGVAATVACKGSKSSFPTQPAANNFNFPDAVLGDVAAAFTAAVQAGEKTVIFSDNSTGSITKYLWQFGDGRKSNAQNPVHTYSKFDTYVVTLTVSNDGSSDSVSQFVTVAPVVVPEPTAPEESEGGG